MFSTMKCMSLKSAVLSRIARDAAFLIFAGSLMFAQAGPPVVVGYYMSNSNFPLNTLVTNGTISRLTHLNYAFADIQDTIVNSTAQNPQHAYSCALHDAASETAPGGVMQQLKSLKASYPNLKLLISVGGANGSGNFTHAADDNHRDDFTRACVAKFLDPSSPQGFFDGIDIDWEFPKASDDVRYYTLLLESFHKMFDYYKNSHSSMAQKKLILTSAIGPQNGPESWKLQNINLFSVQNSADFFNVMAYDYAGSWNAATSSTAPLSSIIDNITDLIRQGLAANKIALGIPFYGVHYTGPGLTGKSTSDSLATLLSSAPTAPATIPNTTDTQDTDYAAVAQLLTSNGSPNMNVKVYHDTDGNAWAFDSATSFLWAYDDEATIASKTAWARSIGLAGVMTWEIGKDTTAGTLLCAMEAGANGLPGSTCSSTGSSSGTPATMLFDFEAGVQEWSHGGGVFNVASSTLHADGGTKSMAVTVSAYQNKGTIWAAPPSLVQPGSTVTFRIWVPSAVSNSLTNIAAFFMDKNWTWTSNAMDLSKLVADSWNTVSVVVPANAVAPYTEIGIEIDSSSSFSGAIYVDSVTVR